MVKADNRISGPVARAALEQLNVDPLGLDQSDHRLLTAIIDKFDGGPVGLETLAASLNEDSDTIMDVWEPYLLQLGFLDRTPAAGGYPLGPRAPGSAVFASPFTDQPKLEGF